MKIYIRLFSIFFVLFIIAIAVYNVLHSDSQYPEENYSAFIARLEKNEIKGVHLKGGHLTATDIRNKKSTTFVPEIENLLPEFEKKNIIVSASPDSSPSISILGGKYWARL